MVLFLLYRSAHLLPHHDMKIIAPVTNFTTTRIWYFCNPCPFDQTGNQQIGGTDGVIIILKQSVFQASRIDGSSLFFAVKCYISPHIFDEALFMIGIHQLCWEIVECGGLITDK